MSKSTPSDVTISQYRAEFRAAPFGRPRWELMGHWQHRETLRHRRRSTVVRDYLTFGGSVDEPAARVPNSGIGHLPESILIDPSARVVFIPNNPSSRFGIGVVIEQLDRT